MSDLHIGHENVLKYDNRPFNNIKDHDKQIIDNINSIVLKDDELYILGDIARKPNKEVSRLAQIRCKNIFFIQGNHDFTKHLKIYEELGWTNLGLMYIDKEAKVVLCHYPMDERFHSRHKDDGRFIHIHGHSHGNSEPIIGRIDIGMTFNPISKPISLNDIKEIISVKDNFYT